MDTSKGISKDVLRISTAGNVDDGKSTLIGRLLYETNSLTEDKLESIERISKKKGLEHLDFSLATDGLIAEREQGITIDVAHIYFSTPKRTYIIADSPGHEEYTRNMITGASSSDISVILIDARHGIREQTRRHLYINSLLKMKHIVFVLNKMDLKGFDEGVFDRLAQDLKGMAEKYGFKPEQITCIPVSALHGDNVMTKSERMPWYSGFSLLDTLESLQLPTPEAPARFAVQTVIRPRSERFPDYRGYAGKLRSGSLKLGDEVVVLPSQQKAIVTGIHFDGMAFTGASAGDSFTLLLSEDIDVSRGSIVVAANEIPSMQRRFRCTVCWLDTRPLNSGDRFLLQQGTSIVQARVEEIESVMEPDFITANTERGCLTLNEIGTLIINCSEHIPAEPFTTGNPSGNFILIDPQSNNTVALGFVQDLRQGRARG